MFVCLFPSEPPEAFSSGLGVGAGLDGSILPSVWGGFDRGKLDIEAFPSRDGRKLEVRDPGFELSGVSKIFEGGELWNESWFLRIGGVSLLLKASFATGIAWTDGVNRCTTEILGYPISSASLVGGVDTWDNFDLPKKLWNVDLGVRDILNFDCPEPSVALISPVFVLKKVNRGRNTGDGISICRTDGRCTDCPAIRLTLIDDTSVSSVENFDVAPGVVGTGRDLDGVIKYWLSMKVRRHHWPTRAEYGRWNWSRSSSGCQGLEQCGQGSLFLRWPKMYCNRRTVPSICNATDARKFRGRFRAPMPPRMKFGRRQTYC